MATSSSGSEPDTDVIVVGGGIAGVSIAAELAARRRVVLLERETELARHATGRSAAVFSESYGGAEIRALTRAGRRDYEEAETEAPLLRPRPVLWITDSQGREKLDAAVASTPGLRPLDPADALRLCPVLRPDGLHTAVEPDARDIDVAALHAHYLRRLRALGGRVRSGTGLQSAERVAGRWEVDCGGTRLRADVIVDAAGAWADDVARRCGASPLGLTPLRRTAALARPGAVGIDPSWPMVVDADETFYFRPEGVGVLLSPADETPTEPSDARPEDVDVALALERVNAATTLGLRAIHTAWAGLRTFAPDRVPVIGHDPAVPGFFWCAGQGGYGIQTAPAAARLGAALLLGAPVPADILDQGLDPERLGPGRFGGA
ncbi:NAD(P)/FAD-dependent oxidoreductase [Marinactinospora thermotolerans]|uniref:Glycine/D-amino acid oxidase n=1 Tax=Marinactinospora thermotolerans DSM 45154 TaxID=1122192 RepID=A0A1T4RRG1_9ACTN|nr:FAD-dependent oxidoreductase [Marinactinospora thermotolerans]SKA18358.1 Glycine/D-amino acid oxidase [Marinactinospora thermotolerans DSM 45154]